MQITFPCGAKGRTEFCPSICQYGKFCKIARTKKEAPRGLKEDKDIIEDISEEIPEVEHYY